MPHSIFKFKGYRLQLSIFLLVGIIIGMLLSIQIRSDTVVSSEAVSKTLQIENSLLASFTAEHKDLLLKLEELRKKRKDLEVVTERNSSKKLQNQLKLLRESARVQSMNGSGIRVTIEDGIAGGEFLSAADMRDLVNALFLQGAKGIVVNGIRVGSLMPIRDAFDTIFFGNRQVSSPFSIEAIGNYEALQFALKEVKTRKVKIYSEKIEQLAIPAYEMNHSYIDAKLLTPENPLSL